MPFHFCHQEEFDQNHCRKTLSTYFFVYYFIFLSTFKKSIKHIALLSEKTPFWVSILACLSHSLYTFTSMGFSFFWHFFLHANSAFLRVSVKDHLHQNQEGSESEIQFSGPLPRFTKGFKRGVGCRIFISEVTQVIGLHTKAWGPLPPNPWFFLHQRTRGLYGTI